MDKLSAAIQISGIVQGVGFRPFLTREMRNASLCGEIRNTSEGVEIIAEGTEDNIDSFIAAIRKNAPALAFIENISCSKSTFPKNLTDIRILPSRTGLRRNTLISPDVATCDDCLKEFFDPADRRYHYPFINCTNCGPRFSIIRDIPYDRCNTTMAHFAMCPDCASEYENIHDRRYHAQPDCCGKCGPELYYTDSTGKKLNGDPITLAANAILDGKIVAIKGLGGIHLACRFDDAETVRELRRRKHRDEKPMAVMFPDVEGAAKYCLLSDDEKRLLTGHTRPIVLLDKKQAAAFPYLSDNRSLGVMLPYTPVHHLLMDQLRMPLVMTSANISDLPIITNNNEALSLLRGIADEFLLNNRDIENRCDDTLIRCVDGEAYFLRRSRGYTPLPISISGARSCILACGAEQKASFSLSRKSHVFQSAHIGDLKNIETLSHYEKQIDLFERMFDVRPEMITCDMHPDYLSTDYARKRSAKEGIPLIPVQHHHAHMASCMADNELDGECIGIIWDGTGYGTDGSIWGGEFLVGSYASFERAGSVRPVALPGGDKAIKDIRRIGIALMMDAGLDPSEFFPAAESVCTMIKANISCPASSGMGRLFDGICAIAGIRSTASYEGQGAVLLESAACDDCRDTYPYSIEYINNMYVFDHRSMTEAIYRDHTNNTGQSLIAAKFMNTLIAMAVEICGNIRGERNLDRIVLSGGVFQNMYLLKRLIYALTAKGFKVYRHRRVSTNDEGISFGQMAVVQKGVKQNVSRSSSEDCRD